MHDDLKKIKGIVGPIWLNYKPGDWDVSGFMFDVDVFRLKMRLALKRGIKFVRDMDASSLNDGLSFIGRTLNKIDGCNWQEEIEFGRKTAEFVSKKGFLADDIKRQHFYSDPR